MAAAGGSGEEVNAVQVLSAYLSSISVAPGGNAQLNISTAPCTGQKLKLECCHSLDKAKCLLSLDISCPSCPHSLKFRVPVDWEAGDVDAKNICGAQALPATQRKLEAPSPPRADVSNCTPYSLCLVVEPLTNPSVTRYRLMQRLESDEMSADQEKANLGCLPNGEPASSFKELAVFNVSNKKGSRKEYQKHVMDLVPGKRYSFLTIAEADHSMVCSEEVVLRTTASRPHTPAAPTLVKPDKKELKFKWLAPEDCGAAITAYEVAMALETPRAESSPFDSEKAQLIYSPTALNEMSTCYAGPETAVTLKSLLPGARYIVRVRACNSEGWSDWSPVSPLTTSAGAPEPPATPTALVLPKHAGKGGESMCIHVKWSPPENDNGASISGYMLEHDKGEGFSSAYRGAQMAYTLVGVAPASAHRFRVRALNAVGHSEVSAAVAVSAPAAPPSPPLRLAAALDKGKSKQLKLKWTAPLEDHGSAVTGYKVYCCDMFLTQGPRAGSADTDAHDEHLECEHALRDGNGEVEERRETEEDRGGAQGKEEEQWVYVQHVSSHFAATLGPHASIADLIPGSHYKVRVTSVSEIGESCPSDSITVTTPPAPPPAPAAPCVSNASTIETTTDATILRSAARGGAAAAAGRRGGRGADGGYVRDVQVDSMAVDVRWEAVRPHQSEGHVQYVLEMCESEGKGPPPEDATWKQVFSGPDTRTAVAGLKPVKNYIFRLCAANSQGQSPLSPQVSHTTPPRPSGRQPPPYSQPPPPPYSQPADKSRGRGAASTSKHTQSLGTAAVGARGEEAPLGVQGSGRKVEAGLHAHMCSAVDLAQGGSHAHGPAAAAAAAAAAAVEGGTAQQKPAVGARSLHAVEARQLQRKLETKTKDGRGGGSGRGAVGVVESKFYGDGTWHKAILGAQTAPDWQLVKFVGYEDEGWQNTAAKDIRTFGGPNSAAAGEVAAAPDFVAHLKKAKGANAKDGKSDRVDKGVDSGFVNETASGSARAGGGPEAGGLCPIMDKDVADHKEFNGYGSSARVSKAGGEAGAGKNCKFGAACKYQASGCKFVHPAQNCLVVDAGDTTCSALTSPPAQGVVVTAAAAYTIKPASAPLQPKVVPSSVVRSSGLATSQGAVHQPPHHLQGACEQPLASAKWCRFGAVCHAVGCKFHHPPPPQPPPQHPPPHHHLPPSQPPGPSQLAPHLVAHGRNSDVGGNGGVGIGGGGGGGELPIIVPEGASVRVSKAGGEAGAGKNCKFGAACKYQASGCKFVHPAQNCLVVDAGDTTCSALTSPPAQGVVVAAAAAYTIKPASAPLQPKVVPSSVVRSSALPKACKFGLNCRAISCKFSHPAVGEHLSGVPSTATSALHQAPTNRMATLEEIEHCLLTRV